MLSPALAVTGATYKKNAVTLTTAPQTPGATKYTVTVNGVKDTSKNALAANSAASFYTYINVKSGVAKFAYWGGIGGNAVSALVEDPRYPATPDLVLPVFSLNSRDAFPDDTHEAYGSSITGLLTPTEGGDYDFFLRSDDGSQLWLSTDATAANLAMIAEEAGCCAAFLEPGAAQTTAAPITLVANKSYYFEILQKEGGGGDYSQVAWRKTTDTTPAAALQPIPGRFLSSTTDLPAPPEGAFVTVTPGANAKNVSPNTKIVISHRDGKTEWTSNNVSLKFNGAAVTPVITKNGNVLTLTYTPPALLGGSSSNNFALTYPDAGGVATSKDWSFTTLAYSGTTKDVVASYPGLMQGASKYTADKGGHTGAAGDTAIDTTKAGGPVVSYSSALTAAINAATANDELSVSFWQKKYDVADSSAFNVNSPSTPNQRAFHAHVPWSDQHIYFDTVGCCDAATQRIQTDIADFAGYTGDAGFFTNSWHQYTFTKKGSTKTIYIDGKFFLSGDNTGKLPTDVDAFYMGSETGGATMNHALMDDFSIYGKELSEADALALFNGTLPTALPAAKGLIAYWNFNDAASTSTGTVSNLKASMAADGKVTISFDGAGGVVQSSDTVNGAYTDTAIKSGDAITPAGQKFYRGKK